MYALDTMPLGPSDSKTVRDTRNERQDRERDHDRSLGIRAGGGHVTIKPNFPTFPTKK